jgi:hypothetical protein
VTSSQPVVICDDLGWRFLQCLDFLDLILRSKSTFRSFFSFSGCQRTALFKKVVVNQQCRDILIVADATKSK